ncbi:myb-binding protein 1A-like protein [Caerostris extrusa]|uniref:Myb-binding protein 1A-like protein n=1 Tax=Caerostris extrusa TaxID=172846 RepID=A0AAV4P5A1_CAEEX|nr:myb-binding protein 1A-like protein [Caerostris extrusa]
MPVFWEEFHLQWKRKDAIFGQLFAYSSIVRCGKLANHSHLSFVVTALFDLWEGKNYILRASYEILLSLFSQLSEEKFIETLWPLFKNRLTFGWEKSSADSIWPLFLCMRLFPDAVTAKFLKKHWNEDIFLYENFDHLKKSLRQTTSCLPTLHPLCAEILHFCMARKDGKDIWNALVDDNLFEIDQTRKAYVGFEMVKKVLQETQKKNKAGIHKYVKSNFSNPIKFVLSPKFCTMFTKSLLSRKHPMNPAAAQLAGFLSNIVKQSKDPDIQMIILKVFLQSSAPFDQMIRLKEVSAIIQNLQPDAVKAYWELLKTFALIKSESDEEEEIGAHSKCFQSVLQIGSLVNHPIVVLDIEWRLNVIKFLFMHSFFDLHAPTEDILHCDISCRNISIILREAFSNSFYKAVNSLHQHSISLEQCLQHLLSITEYADQLMAATQFVTPCSSFRTGFHLFHDQDHISEVLEELQVCCKKALHERKHSEESNENEPSWICVVVDILLSLLSRSSNNLRCIVTTVFPLLCPFITKEALQPILDVINPEKRRRGANVNEESNLEFDSGSSDEESDDEMELTDDKVDEKFRAEVKKALGPAADDSDAESIVLSDSEMSKLDDALAKVFQSRVQTGHTQLSAEDKTMLHFRNRCFDLIISYFKSELPMDMVLHCIHPIIAAYEHGQKKNQTQLLHKAVSAIQILIKNKEVHRLLECFENLENVQKSDLKEHLEILVAKCHKETNLVVAKKLYSLCVFLVLCFRRLEAQKNSEKVKIKKGPAYMKVYEKALEQFIKSSSNMYPQFFVSLMELCPDLAWNFIKPYEMFAFDTGIRIYKRTQCLGLIFEALKFSKGQNSISTEQWMEIGNTLINAAVENLKTVLSNSEIKPVYLTELLNVIHTTNFILKEKTNQSLLENHKDILPLLSDMNKGQLKKLMKKGSAVRRKIILALGGSIPSNTKKKENISMGAEEEQHEEMNNSEEIPALDTENQNDSKSQGIEINGSVKRKSKRIKEEEIEN